MFKSQVSDWSVVVYTSAVLFICIDVSVLLTDTLLAYVR